MPSTYCDICGFNSTTCQHTHEAEHAALVAEYSTAAPVKVDPLMVIIEAAYHCAWHNHEIHAAVKEAGLDEVSDETIANLLGEYANSVKPAEG